MLNTIRWVVPGVGSTLGRYELVTRTVSWTLTTRARRVSARGVLARKRHALDAHVSQTATLAPAFVAQFLEDDELFFPFHDPYLA